MQRREFITLLGGTVVAWPLVARAQKTNNIPKIGVLWHAGSMEEEAIYLAAFQQGLRDFGYIDGQNIKLVNTFANEQYERFNSNAGEFARSNVDIIVAVTLPAALAAQRATKTIPVVFILVPDPVAAKLVDSLAKPGGNITGLSQLAVDLLAKRLEIFKETVSGLSQVALLINPSDQDTTRRTVEQIKAAADRLNLIVQPIEARGPEQLEQAFSVIGQDKINGMIVQPDGLFFNARARIAELALMRGLPTMVFNSSMVEAGGLMTYAPSSLAIFRRAGTYVDKILKGTKPVDLPVELPTRFELVINLKTAKTLGLTIPPTLLSQADKVIE
jgi:putative ABC transport system substrate-binding protein